MIRLILFIILFPAVASAGQGSESIFDKLLRQGAYTVSPVRLVVPMDSVVAKVPGKQNANFSFENAGGEVFRFELNVEVRGRFRRNRCGTPPLKLDFDKKELAARGLKKYDKYKLVLPCFSGTDGEALVLKEYLAYRAYALLSPYHFRTQLLELTLVDAAGIHPDRTVVAFIIEENDEMAERLGGKKVEDALGKSAQAFDAEAEAAHALVQFMVGNADWSLPLARNVKLVRLPAGQLIPVGYDFDFSGWVGAPYASPTTQSGQRSIYERVYLGYAQTDDVMQAVITRMTLNRRAVMKLIQNSPLDEEHRIPLSRFAARFFSQINRLRSSPEVPIYDQLRGATAVVIPVGDRAEHFRSMGR